MVWQTSKNERNLKKQSNFLEKFKTGLRSMQLAGQSICKSLLVSPPWCAVIPGRCCSAAQSSSLGSYRHSRIGEFSGSFNAFCPAFTGSNTMKRRRSYRHPGLNPCHHHPCLRLFKKRASKKHLVSWKP